MDKDEQSLVFPESPAGGDRDNTTVPPSNKSGKKKKRARKKQSTDRAPGKTQPEHSGSAPSHVLARQKKTPDQKQPKTTRDQATQTEASVNEVTQTPPPQCGHTQPTESKSTQTTRSKLTLKEVYDGQACTDEKEHQACASNQSRDPQKLTLLTWNIDGLDLEDIRERSRCLLSYLGHYRADVVLLQELIPPYLKILQETMTDYEFVVGNDEGYFTGILLRKCRVELLQSNIVKYPTTEMGRNLLLADVNFSDHQLCFMTSHLESMRASSQERMNQLRRVWKRLKEAPDGQTVIFGGDTNLRDAEVRKLGGLPDGISDVWEMLGEPEDCRYTWDTVNNNNKELPFPACLRFDRVYLRKAREGLQLRPDTMTLVGMKRLPCGRFTSDHWGILCTFSFQSSEE